MKRGDVFKVGDSEQLYYADAIAPNGSIYALPYDPETGKGRKLTIFQSDVECQVLFNNRKTPPKPEPLKFETGWDYCEIIRKSEDVAPYAYETRWVAQTIDASKATLGKSNVIGNEWRDGQKSSVMPESTAEYRQKLVDELRAKGWQVMDGPHKGYLRRKQ